MKHHEHFMRLAIEQAKEALQQGEFPVGCVLVKNDKVLASSYRQNSSGVRANEMDHAEVMALRKLLHRYPSFACTDVVAYSTMQPCLMCFSTLLLSGVRRFVWAYEDIMGGGTDLPMDMLPELYADMEVEIVPRVLRSESLALFQEFFRRYDYWRGSQLAQYTLAQEIDRN